MKSCGGGPTIGLEQEELVRDRHRVEKLLLPLVELPPLGWLIQEVRFLLTPGLLLGQLNEAPP